MYVLHFELGLLLLSNAVTTHKCILHQWLQMCRPNKLMHGVSMVTGSSVLLSSTHLKGYLSAVTDKFVGT